jgi:hypothetical protein
MDANNLSAREWRSAFSKARAGALMPSWLKQAPAHSAVPLDRVEGLLAILAAAEADAYENEIDREAWFEEPRWNTNEDQLEDIA